MSSPTCLTFSGCEDRLLGDLEAFQCGDCSDRPDAGEIFGDEDAIFLSARLDDFFEDCVRHRRAHEGDIEHSGKTDVRDVLAFAPQEAPVLLARKTGSDAFAGHAADFAQAAAASGGRIEASAS
jgi:hypothetical protein